VRPRIELFREGCPCGSIAAGQVQLYPQGLPAEALKTLETQTRDVANVDQLDWEALHADWFAAQRSHGLRQKATNHRLPIPKHPLNLQFSADEVLVGPALEPVASTPETKSTRESTSSSTVEQDKLDLSRQQVILRGHAVLQVGDAAIRAPSMLLDMPRGIVQAAGPVICRWGAYQNPPLAAPSTSSVADAPSTSQAVDWSPHGGVLVGGRCTYDLEQRRLTCDRVAGALRIHRAVPDQEEHLLPALETFDEVTALGLPWGRSFFRRLKDSEPQGARGWQTRSRASNSAYRQTAQTNIVQPEAAAAAAAAGSRPHEQDMQTLATMSTYDPEAAYLRLRAERVQLRLGPARLREWVADQPRLAEAIHFSERALYDARLEWDPSSGPKHPGAQLEASRLCWHDRPHQEPEMRIQRALLKVNKRLALPVLQRQLSLGQGGLSPAALDQLLDLGRSMTRFAYDVEQHGGFYLSWPLWTDSLQAPAGTRVHGQVDLLTRLAASIPFLRRWVLHASLALRNQRTSFGRIRAHVQFWLEQPSTSARSSGRIAVVAGSGEASDDDRLVPAGATAGAAHPTEASSRLTAENPRQRQQMRQALVADAALAAARSSTSSRNSTELNVSAARRPALRDGLRSSGRVELLFGGSRSFQLSYHSDEVAFQPFLPLEVHATADEVTWPLPRSCPWTRLGRHWLARGTLWQRRRVSAPEPRARVLEGVHIGYERVDAAVLPSSALLSTVPARSVVRTDERVQRMVIQYGVQVESLLYAGRRTRAQRTRPYLASFAALDARLERTRCSFDQEPWTLRGALVGGLRAQFGCFQRRFLDATGFLIRVRQSFGVPSPLLYQYEAFPTSLHLGCGQQVWGPLRVAAERVWLYCSGYSSPLCAAKDSFVPLETNYVVEWQQPTFKIGMIWSAERHQGQVRASMTW